MTWKERNVERWRLGYLHDMVGMEKLGDVDMVDRLDDWFAD